METPSTGMPDTYDRLMSGLTGLPGVIATKPSTVRTIVPITGASQTWVISTYRQRHEGVDGKSLQSRDTIFLETTSRDGLVRLVIPPAAADVIARHRDALTGRSRRSAAKAVAADRKARGEVPGFMKRRSK